MISYLQPKMTRAHSSVLIANYTSLSQRYTDKIANKSMTHKLSDNKIMFSALNDRYSNV